MAMDQMSQLAVCPVCEEVFQIDGELPLCENCLTRLDRWMPEEVASEVSGSTR